MTINFTPKVKFTENRRQNFDSSVNNPSISWQLRSVVRISLVAKMPKRSKLRVTKRSLVTYVLFVLSKKFNWNIFNLWIVRQEKGYFNWCTCSNKIFQINKQNFMFIFYHFKLKANQNLLHVGTKTYWNFNWLAYLFVKVCFAKSPHITSNVNLKFFGGIQGQVLEKIKID